MDKQYLQYLMYTDFYRIYGRAATVKDKLKLLLNYCCEPGVRFLRVFRKYQYARETHKLSRRYWALRHQQLSNKYGIVMPPSVKIGKGFAIFHINGIVINSVATFGDNCSVLQQVTVGNSRTANAPRIGNDCKLLAGSKIIGNIKLEDGVTVGANAVVIRDCPANSVWGGVPARLLKNEKLPLVHDDYMTFEEWKLRQ